MLLTQDKSICEKRQKIVVSKDDRQSRVHRAINPQQKYDLRHYKLDGNLIKYQTCCDFLLLNDSLKKAYFIELKGENIDEAVEQLESTALKLRSELKDYICLYRIVSSRVPTHKVHSTKYRKFQEKCGARLITKSRKMEEELN